MVVLVVCRRLGSFTAVQPLEKRSATKFGSRPVAGSQGSSAKDGFRLVAAGDPASLNVGRHGYQTFDDGKVERPLHLHYRQLNGDRPTQQTDS